MTHLIATRYGLVAWVEENGTVSLRMATACFALTSECPILSLSDVDELEHKRRAVPLNEREPGLGAFIEEWARRQREQT